jgi:hypothetical protein
MRPAEGLRPRAVPGAEMELPEVAAPGQGRQPASLPPRGARRKPYTMRRPVQPLLRIFRKTCRVLRRLTVRNKGRHEVHCRTAAAKMQVDANTSLHAGFWRTMAHSTKECPMRKSLLLLMCAFCAGTAGGAEKIPGQKPLIIIGDKFQFITGSWATYQILDKAKNETYRMHIAVLERDKKQRPLSSWMEIGVESKGNPAVVTRFLAEETAQGPGKMFKVIVQVAGYSPFNVPKKYFQGKNAEVAPTVPAQILKRLEKRAFKAGSRQVEGWEVEAEDAKGARTRGVVSEEVAPIGVLEAESNDVKMTLEDFGMDARTRITGTPLPFSLWILEQIAKEMGKIQ